MAINILAISGSTRLQSTNHTLINIIAAMYAGKAEITQFDGLSQLPHFNPDDDNDTPPPTVTAFRDRLRLADGILICTPEYAMGVPGSLKNALDWIVSSMEMSQKPVALITASSMGELAHQSLTGTLRVIEADLPDTSRLLIPFVKAKVRDGAIVDAPTLESVKSVMESLLQGIAASRSKP
ncbi:NADPH-dependent FMN reductase [Chitinophaga caseinilytica]|uniref:NADPH-dependent FMN reductase n=1 Tax=Chitinophaga caseinilytica TaxID=2267521 RepID=UPI003C2E5780